MSTTATTPERKTTEPFPGYELKITRVFDAPRDLVWQAWTDPSMQMEWMGPRGFTTTELDMPKTPGAPWRRTVTVFSSKSILDRPMSLGTSQAKVYTNNSGGFTSRTVPCCFS